MAHQPLLLIQYQIHFYTYGQFYFKQFSLVNNVKWFQVLVCITNNSINMSHSFTQLNVKTVLLQTIQFSISADFSSI